MLTNLTKQDLIDFEQDIANIYKEGKIKAPVHLRGGNEEQLIKLFMNIRPKDWIFGYWALHLEALLKGVPKQELKQQIIEGHSIALKLPKYRVFGSGIVASLNGVAVGAAYAAKQKGIDEHVYLFTGDMGAECGLFHEAIKYSTYHDLPITFVVQDNGLSVVTDTAQTWGYKIDNHIPWWVGTPMEDKIYYIEYKNIWPHSGIGQRIKF